MTEQNNNKNQHLPNAQALLGPQTVNWHLEPTCNYECTFCFQTYADDRRRLGGPDAERVVDAIAAAGCEKLTFVGGEPLLHPDIVPLIQRAKARGLTTMVVTNGTRLNASFLDAVRHTLDWVTLSIDSADDTVNAQLGRGFGGHVDLTRRRAAAVHRMGMALKVNTVVTRPSWEEDMRPLLRELRPRRWKIFQFLPIQGENDANAPYLEITPEQFASFVSRHRSLEEDGVPVVPESNGDMTGTYVMLDPLGRVFQNFEGKYRIGPSVTKAGLMAALRLAGGWDRERFVARGGVYDWSVTPKDRSGP